VKANVIGLPVTDGMVRVEDLIEWIEERDAACAEYLVEALREYQDKRRGEVAGDR
jgi:hypothetical protein